MKARKNPILICKNPNDMHPKGSVKVPELWHSECPLARMDMLEGWIKELKALQEKAKRDYMGTK